MGDRTSKSIGVGTRRVVVGPGSDGAELVADGRPAPQVVAPNVAVTELWKVNGLPADLSSTDDGCEGEFQLVPPAGGATLRFIELPPDSAWKGPVGDGEQSGDDGFHQTDTVDFVVITKGEVWCVTEGQEVKLEAGDTLVQLGGNHAWSVRTEEPCQMVAVLLDADRSGSKEA